MLSVYDPDGHLPSGIDRSVVALDRLRIAGRVPQAQHVRGLGTAKPLGPRNLQLALNCPFQPAVKNP